MENTEAYKKIIELVATKNYDAEKIAISLAQEFPSIFLQLHTDITKWDVSEHDINIIIDHRRYSRAIEAIKLIRTIGGFGLKEAKDIYDNIEYPNGTDLSNEQSLAVCTLRTAYLNKYH